MRDVVTSVSAPNLGLTLRGVMTPCVFVAWFSPECQTCRVAAVRGGQAFHLHSSCHPFDMQSRPHSGVLPPVPGRSSLQPSFSPGCGSAVSRERLETVVQLHWRRGGKFPLSAGPCSLAAASGGRSFPWELVGVLPAFEHRAGSLGARALLGSWLWEGSFLLALFLVNHYSHCSLCLNFLHMCMNTIRLGVFFPVVWQGDQAKF